MILNDYKRILQEKIGNLYLNMIMRSLFFKLPLLCLLHCANSLMEPSGYLNVDNADADIYQILNSKDYLPNENDLPKAAIIKKDDNDATYILSKLSDEELIKLLSQEPKRNEYDLKDLVNLADNTEDTGTLILDKTKNDDHQKAFFRLEDKEVEPYNSKPNADPKFNAYMKLSNLIYSRPQQQSSDEDDEKKEMLFDILVAQLKTLCCKKTKPKINTITRLKSLLKKVTAEKKAKYVPKSTLKDNLVEHIFLVINDEIRSPNETDDLITVDPESLSMNSSVLLLGPIVTPLSDGQLKLVISRITNELSKPEYLPLLDKISKGGFGNSSLGLKKSIITGDSRRYIKPHRCNHQSKLARVYGGPKWLICTGYLNINTPSLYD